MTKRSAAEMKTKLEFEAARQQKMKAKLEFEAARHRT
jgi:hypothetical protein